MTLTTKQQEEIVRLRAKSTKLNDELEKITILNVILTPIKYQEIANIKIEIALYIDHAGMTRDGYIEVVQPLKNQRRDLIQQNKVIIQENNTKKQVAQQQYQDNISVIQQQINNNETELLNAIKTVDLSKTMLEK